MDKRIAHKIEQWKTQLLDFSRRNRLYHFSPTRRTSLEIALDGEDVFDFLQRFVKDGLSYDAPDPQWEDETEEDESLTEDEKRRRKELIEQRKTLLAIRQKAKQAWDEKGVNILYLIVGMFRWKESPMTVEETYTPLILVPVQLKCANLSAPIEISLLDDDEIQLNNTLKQKIGNDFGVHLPEYNHNEDFEGYYNLLKERLSSYGVIEDGVTLALLSFSKISMYVDLESHQQMMAQNHLIRTICGVVELDEPSVKDDTVDLDAIKPQDVYQVLDADSTQMQAIEAAKKGKSFVLQGPPGTGKSQTITNIIAEAMQAGRSVLFVSEKKAALDVVYRRLESVGLGVFCLSLHHSGKSASPNKTEARRQVLDQFDAVLKQSRSKNVGVINLSRLEAKRTELNAYPRVLHLPCTALQESYFSVAGKLSLLNDKPDVIVDIISPEAWSQVALEEKCSLLKSYAVTIGNRSVDYAQNPWRGANVSSLSQSIEKNIDAYLAPLVEALEEVNAYYRTFSARSGIKLPWHYEKWEKIEDFLNTAAEATPFPSAWIEERERLPQYKVEIEASKQEASRAHLISDKLGKQFTDSFVKLSADSYVAYLDITLDLIRSELTCSNLGDNEIVEQVGVLADSAESTVKELTMLFEEASGLAEAVGLLILSNLRGYTLVHDVCHICSEWGEQTRVPKSWFNKKQFSHAEKEWNDWREKHYHVLAQKKKLLACFDKEVLDFDTDAILRRFRQDYSSFLRYFTPSYYKDLKELKFYYRGAESLSYPGALRVLTDLKDIRDTESEIEDSQILLKELYGETYQGYETDWDRMKLLMSGLSDLMSVVGAFSEPLQDLLVAGRLPLNEMKSFAAKWQKVLPLEKYRKLKGIFSEELSGDTDFKQYCLHRQGLINAMHDYAECFQELSQMCVTPADYEFIRAGIGDLSALQNIRRKWEVRDDDFRKRYPELYSGFATNWEELLLRLSNVQKLVSLMEEMSLPFAFATRLADDATLADECRRFDKEIGRGKKIVQAYLPWYQSFFGNGKMFEKEGLETLQERIAACMSNKHQLGEWIDYCSEYSKCEKGGLGEYLRAAEAQKVPAEDIVPAFEKRFYSLWMDAVEAEQDEIKYFRAEKREALIEEFKELDLKQFDVAQKRVKNAVLARCDSHRREALCRKEEILFEKQRKSKRPSMPMRILLKKIPHLAIALKPCFMMSPLAVSTYLSPSDYSFDLVIFDEASQVHTEDAVGAIMRGRQVIIVGDENQLPPTDFFKTSLTDGAGNNGTNAYYDDASFESILTEAEAVRFPKIKLCWHYRSRHEHLIAFSNKRIYDNELITFPSAVAEAPDMGVEYIKVTDGLYRPKARINEREAQVVAELVIKHFQTYGSGRSLGVVTFSDAQRGAIEDCLNRELRKKRYLESYLNEDGAEPFFIKNLENVQGDERDTMIFSICYARTAPDERMRLHMGPLNNQGGKRRLNVAITRAKYNVKLVGSIEPEDLAESDNEGITLLRDYIKFAQRGVSALSLEEDSILAGVTESPFEESVLRFLQSRGFMVETQVGCSGYRIDMAVKHPQEPNRYVLGIECDGKTYHEPVTARERDRLRQTVLEDMGWTLYRIWSTDWVRSRAVQEKALLHALEIAGATTKSV